MPPTRPLHVLVVDDDPDAATTTTALLALHGFRATRARDAQEALAAAPADPPDVVLIDLGMPGVDGFEVARRLRGLALPRPPILIALTGVTANWDRERADAAGFALYLVKPVPPEELLAVLRECEVALVGKA